MSSRDAPSSRTFAERVAEVERYLAEEVNDEVDQIPSDMSVQALLDCIREQQAALQRAEAHDESVHEFEDLECFCDDLETHKEFYAEYIRRRNQRSLIEKYALPEVKP